MSSFIKLQSISFSFDNLSSDIFSNLSVDFHLGWTSVCGPNGSGKTTLFKLISNELKPNSGLIKCQGKLVIVPQSTEEKPFGLEDFRYNYEKKAIKFREKLGVDESWYDRWDSLSIGERKRLQIAIALSESPDILLVDEPSNHVDLETKKVLLQSLKNFSGTGLMISHDRLFLNELCQQTAFLESKALKYYSSSYDIAKNELRNHYSSQVSHKETLKREEKKTKRAIQDQKDKIEQGKKNLSKKNISKKDHDAKSKINLAKVSGADFKDGRKKKVLSEKANRLSESISNFKTKKTYDLGVFFKEIPRVKTLYFPETSYDLGFLKLDLPEITLSKDDKLIITGKNGAGKSTLLKKWLSLITDRYSYAPQEFTEEEIQNLTNKLVVLDKETRGKIFTLISCFGSDPKSLNSGSRASPGVWQKLMIALAIIQESPILILDEPTNHMDLDAIEVLEEALTRFSGILICISHDENFINRIGNQFLHIEKKESNSIASFSFQAHGK